MQKNYFIHTLVVLACAGIFLAFVFARIQHEIYLSHEITLKQNQDFYNKIAFTRFSCSFPTAVENTPVLQSIKGDLYSVDSTYVPRNLTLLPAAYNNSSNLNIYIHAGVQEPLIQMLNQAKEEGISLGVNSGYRDFARQKRIYQNPLNKSQPPEYDRAARPGYSEHQLGTAVDISAPIFANQFVLNQGYSWLAENAHLYGFVLSYPKGSEAITGFRYEPWHHRYVGKDIAMALKESGELFNETSTAFYTNPFDESASVRHSFLSDSLYVGLVSLFGNKTLISEDFLNQVLTPEELQSLVSQSKDTSEVSITREGEGLATTTELMFSVSKDTVRVDENEYERTQIRTQIEGTDEWIFVDILDFPILYSDLLFAYKGKFDQSDLLQKYIIENCR